MRKILFTLGALLSVLVVLPLFAAFEAHVVNVTATVDNALDVPVQSLTFGTVFPQQQLDETFNVALSQAFINSPRVDDVSYFIRQKPKCQIIDPRTDAPQFAQVSENVDGTFICPAGYQLMPLLCPYLSKHEVTTDGTAPGNQNDGADQPAFHGPITTPNWNLNVAKSFDVLGYLAKSQQDTSDTWNIDLKVPCFEGQCAQDWPAFVHAANPGANPDAYKQPVSNEGKLMGCDLWLEVKGISCANTGGTFSVVSDTGDTVTETGTNAFALSFVHPEWAAGTAGVPGATWIWSSDPVANPTINDTETFNKSFTIIGTPTVASVVIAIDNLYSIYVNGTLVGQELVDADNFHAGKFDTYPVTNLHPGVNTIKVVATNLATPNDSDPSHNPAGIRYNLTYTTQNSCNQNN